MKLEIQMNERIKSIHELYCQLTGFRLRLEQYGRERSWYEFLLRFVQSDLRLVIIRLQHEIHKGKRLPGSLRFSNLIQQLDRFEEELCLAKAYSRNNKPQSNRENIIKAFRPEVVPAEQSESCKPAKEVVERLIENLKKAAQ